MDNEEQADLRTLLDEFLPNPDDGGGDMEQRAHPVSFYTWANAYFSLGDDSQYEDCNMLIKKKNERAKHFVVKFMSKTLPIGTCDNATSVHVRTFLVFRAWAMCRPQHTNFHMQKQRRLSLLEVQIGSLQHHIRNLCVPTGGTGASDADDLIRKCALDFLS